jgi:hypothetical protein
MADYVLETAALLHHPSSSLTPIGPIKASHIFHPKLGPPLNYVDDIPGGDLERQRRGYHHRC